MQGLLWGAGSGAVTGAQFGSAAGPGAAVGAGLGVIAGGIHGYVQDRNEDQMIRMSVATKSERQRSIAQEKLNDHYSRRVELHPGRDIFPADIFFFGDQMKPNSSAPALVREIADLNKTRYPWSRLGVAVYIQSKAKDPEFARRLALERSKELGDLFVRAGIEPRSCLLYTSPSPRD